MIPYYPVALDLRDRLCLVVGGGPVAEAKVEGLLEAGARVTVVSPEVTELLAAWAIDGRIIHRPHEYRAGDLDGQQLVFSATDRREVTEAVVADARRRGLWVNAADDPAFCDSPEYDELVELAAEVRAELRSRAQRPVGEAWRGALDRDLVGLLAEGRRDEAKARLLERLGVAG